jgi:histidinol-phosphate aminotransferase
VFSKHAFAVYPLATMSAGAECIAAVAKNYGHDPEAMLAAIRPDTHMVWIANPNNPTGNFLPQAEVRAFIEKIPAHIAVVLDEAYTEYLAPADRADTVAWIKDFPNLLVVRTFSKIYGLAGLRVGYGVGRAEVIDLLNRVRQPFNVNNLALAGAIAALDDHEFLARSYESNRSGMEQIVAGLKRLGLSHIPSHGNFVTFEVAETAAVNGKLLKQGVIVRPIGGYGMPNHLRVTIGLETENARFLEALEQSL